MCNQRHETRLRRRVARASISLPLLIAVAGCAGPARDFPDFADFGTLPIGSKLDFANPLEVPFETFLVASEYPAKRAFVGNQHEVNKGRRAYDGQQACRHQQEQGRGAHRYAPSPISPCAMNSSRKLGTYPVARYCPRTWPVRLVPVRWNSKIS